MTLYDYIIEGLQNSGNFYDQNVHRTFEYYLQSLQEPAKKLWKSYRFDRVKVEYSDSSIQAAYLIRYYPHYAYMTLQIFNILHNQNVLGNLMDTVLQICFFGAGPCPEIVGLAKLLSIYYQGVKKLVANVYDIASDEWSLSRAVTEKFVIPQIWQGQLEFHSDQLDLCKSNCLYALNKKISESKIFIFQNCLNEIYNLSTVQDNFNFLINQVPSGSLIVIADLCNYQQNATIVDKLENQVINRHDFEIYRPGIISIQAYPLLPPIIEKNLLIGQDCLIARKRDIECLFISLHKTNPNYYQIAPIPF
ncbi:hypothetical protein VB715_08795 [Crocosphaera sp. UHCC 0190]|uniref:hypothetical protein n=1 Tax=Crocosphaera sp. UHCC 0190 TaxID=3110246 RepID=UPI002B21539D|nr:hypothetical protein [Crocosphaera sp. UHCC 0190]MEA5509859.1 hypothetical protein [Crocosphaera sp. UHCC 0190]